MAEALNITYDKTDDAGVAHIELPEESGLYKGESGGRMFSGQISQVPAHVVERLKTAHFEGRLKPSLDHWIGTLDGGGILDKRTIANVTALRAEITGKYEADKQVLDKIKAVLGGLKARKLR